MSRVEELQGRRWARETCESLKHAFKGWKASLIQTLERGLVEKPEGYKVGVQEIIELVRGLPEGKAEQERLEE